MSCTQSPQRPESVPPSFRVGFGTDLHRLEGGEGFPLGGVRIPCAFRSIAVSDGDVLLHALADALLGACGWGDIGEWFPESAVSPGQASSLFINAICAKMRESAFRVVNVDAVIDLDAVRLSPCKAAIRESLGALLGIPLDRVNIKAKTAEGLGAVGECRAVAAQAVVLVERFS